MTPLLAMSIRVSYSHGVMRKSHGAHSSTAQPHERRPTTVLRLQLGHGSRST
jgi:hypothetical protein